MKIDDLSTKELVVRFDKSIDPKANAITDLWKGYRPISKKYNIKQIESNNGKNFQSTAHNEPSNKILDKNNVSKINLYFNVLLTALKARILFLII